MSNPTRYRAADGSGVLFMDAELPDPCLLYRDETSQSALGFVGEFYERPREQNVANVLLQQGLGENLLRELAAANGSFAAVFHNGERGEWLLITDHTNSRPIFLCCRGDALYFSTDMLHLLAIEELPIAPDFQACCSYLTGGYLTGRRTLVEGIRQVDYATAVRIRNGRLREERYWSYEIHPSPGGIRAEKRARLFELVQRATRLRLDEGRTALALSGGTDSRAILLSLPNPEAVVPFCYTAYQLSTRPPDGDWAVAEQLCRSLGLSLKVLQYDPNDYFRAMVESVYYTVLAGGFIFEQDVRPRIREATGCVSILWGDECAGWLASSCRVGQEAARIGMHRLADFPAVQALLRPDKRDEWIMGSEEDVRAALARTQGTTPQDRVDELYHHERLAHFIMPKRTYQVRFGSVCRMPLLDRNVLEFVARLPGEDRFGKSLLRDVVRNYGQSLSHVPLGRRREDVPYLDLIASSEKRTRLMRRLLTDGSSFADGLFDRRALENFISVVERHHATSVSHPFRVRLPGWLRAPLRALRARWSHRRSDAPGMEVLARRVLTLGVAFRLLEDRFSASRRNELLSLKT